MTTFETDRLVVREWTEDPADLARIFDIYSRWEVARWLGAEPKTMDDPAQAVDAVRRWNGRPTEDDGSRHGVWAVQVRDTGQVAGTLLVKLLPGVDNAPTSDVEVGWHLHPDSWGHGYATEAARGAIDRAFAAGLPEIYAVVRPGNEASMAVTRRLDMTPLGRRTNWYGGSELAAFVRRADQPRR